MTTAETPNETYEQGADRAAQLRAVALELFTKNGFDATTMDRIARGAGVSKRTPYLYYENKHDLFSAVTLVFLREIEDRLAAIWIEQAPAVEILREALRAYAAFALEDPVRFDLIMTFERRDFYPGRTEALPDNARACQEVNNRITLRLHAAIERAKEEGGLETTLSAGQFGLLLWSALVGVVSIATERRTILPIVYEWTAEEMIEEHISSALGTPSNKERR